MSLLDSLFGAGAQQSMLGQQGAAGSYMSTAQGQLAANQASAYNQTLAKYNTNPFAKTSQWVFAGAPCTVQEFADLIWPGEHEDKMLFLLTHSGPDK